MSKFTKKIQNLQKISKFLQFPKNVKIYKECQNFYNFQKMSKFLQFPKIVKITKNSKKVKIFKKY